MPVCTTCRGLKKTKNKLPNGPKKGSRNSARWADTTIAILRISAANCRACALLLRGIMLFKNEFDGVPQNGIKVIAETFHPRPPDDAHDHLSVELRWEAPSDESTEKSKGTKRQFDHHDNEDGLPNLKLEFFTGQENHSEFSIIGKGRNIDVDPLQESGITKVRGFIEQCDKNHSLCQKQKPGPLPRRILDVSMEDPSKEIRLRRYGPDDCVKKEYMVLLYCWGTGQEVPQTTMATLEDHKKLIAWDTLSKTFQEAVLFTKALGIDYLWIDSLCVVQDNFSEKLHASIDLDAILGNAFLTIAATYAEDPSQGLFSQIKQPREMIRSKNRKSTSSNIYVREQPGHCAFKLSMSVGSPTDRRSIDLEAAREELREARSDIPLVNAVWPYVGRMLSRRTLHFTDSEMILQCREATQCECGRVDDETFDWRITDAPNVEFAEQIAEANRRTSESRIKVGTRMDSIVPELANGAEMVLREHIAQQTDQQRDQALEYMDAWSSIVASITAREFTQSGEQLLAAAPIAKAFSKVINSSYIAGHWTNSTLTLNLLWFPKEDLDCRRPKIVPGLDAPSWSWASVEGSEIGFNNECSVDLACTAIFPTRGSKTPIFSPINGVTITLSAALAVEVPLQARTSDQDSREIEYYLKRNGFEVRFMPDVNPLRGADACENGEDVVCVLFCMPSNETILGLVLKQLNKQPLTYRRIGRFDCDAGLIGNKRADGEDIDAEALFDYWFPEVEDLSKLDELPRRTFSVI